MTAGWDAELTELVTHRGGALVSHAYMLVGDRREAEDLVQDALVKVYSKFRRPRTAGTSGMARDTSLTGSPGPTSPASGTRTR